MSRFALLLGVTVLLLAVCASESTTKKKRQPNIIFILADDMGWGDVQWSLIPEVPTPNLAWLKAGGTELTQMYAQSKCTPSRAALLTGRYPWRFGAGSKTVFKRHQNSSLDQSLKLLPSYLKDLGYATHMVGKWHLGYCSKNDIPTSRGFDTFFGSWTNTGDYFHHDALGYDWNWNDKPYFAANGTYNTHLITNHTQHMLRQHFTNRQTKKEPIFMYVAYLAPHTPLQVPEEYIENTNCSLLSKGRDRKICCGMINAVDEGIGNITQTLRELGKLDNTIIIFSSDNGGADNSDASNWPLRGSKQTDYEGGTRVRTVMYSPRYLAGAPKIYDGLVHFTDFLPTLYHAATGRKSDLPVNMDGISFWSRLRRDIPTKRKWMVYGIDSGSHKAALRLKNSTHDFKLVYWKHRRMPGWTGQGDPRLLETLRKRYDPPKDFYRLFNMATNPTEFEPNATYPDAALLFPEVKKLMIRKLEEFKKQEGPIPNWGDIPKTAPGRPNNNNGAYGVGDCDV